LEKINFATRHNKKIVENNIFKFKKFLIRQEKTTMKVGTDGVLLGAWSNVENAVSALDIGCGTGLIALMIAQRNAKIKVDAVEIDADAAAEAIENVRNSIFAEKIEIFSASIQNFAEICTKKYDLIVSNPPFFANSLKCSNPKRNLARHADTLIYSDLLLVAEKLLEPNGLFSVIFPEEQCDNFIFSADKQKLFLVRQTKIFTTPKSKCRRRLMTFSKKNSAKFTDKLIIENSPNSFTREYVALTKDFYLKF
jgi:tRNA1Val (adenine37-N6)-methyltransferase